MNYELKWDHKKLIEYGNFIVNYLKENRGMLYINPNEKHVSGNNITNFLKEFLIGAYIKYFNSDFPKNFTELLGGKECAKIFTVAAEQPRKFNFLFGVFIQQLELEASSSKTPFIGDSKCGTVKKAIKSIEIKYQ